MIRYLLLIAFLLPFSFFALRTDAKGHSPEVIEVYDFDTVDSMPEFPGGEWKMLEFINRERRYPADAYRKGVEGRVRCSFVVNPDGRISHVNVLKGVENSLDDEAVRIINSMPRWKAGAVNDTPVPVYCILAIPFRR